MHPAPNIDVLIDGLSIDDLERLARRHFTPSALRRRRLAERDEAIRKAARTHYPLEKRSRIAAMMASDLETPPHEATALGASVASILRLNDGRPLAWRQLAEILDGWR